MKTEVMLNLRVPEVERTALAIAARRKGLSMAAVIRGLLFEDQLFRRELARAKRESVAQERELVGG
jgi:hypothetical protein